MTRMAVLWFALAIVAGALLFKTSQQVNDGRQRLAAITQEMRREEDSLRVLQAEWSYLNQPERLEKLSKQYLKLTPMKGQQFARIDSLPLRPVSEEPAAPAETPMLAAYGAETLNAAAPSASEIVTPVATTAPAKPARKPAELKPASASLAPAAAHKTETAKTPAPAKAAAAVAPTTPAANKPAQGGRNFSDVLNSLGGGL